MRFLSLAFAFFWMSASGCEYVFQEGSYPTLSGEYALQKSRSGFSGYQSGALDGTAGGPPPTASQGFLNSPQSYPFEAKLPERIEVWMDPLNQKFSSEYQYRVHLLVDLPGAKGVLLESALSSDGKSKMSIVPTDTFDDATSPVSSDGRGYSCRWEVGSTLEIQFNRQASEFEKIYPRCEFAVGTNRTQPVCVTPAPGYETTLPLHLDQVDTRTPLEFTLTLKTFRFLRADSSSWLCSSNPNYVPFEVGNQVLGTYQMVVPNWNLGDPRIQDNADIVIPLRQRIAEVRSGNQSDLIRTLFQVPRDGLSLNGLYPPVEWVAPDRTGP